MSKDLMNNKNENSVKREYSDQEIKKILSEDIETPGIRKSAYQGYV